MHIDLAVVEDNPGDVALIRGMLAESARDAFTVRTVTDLGALEALCASAKRPDVVLLDLNLPGFSGIEAIARVRNECPGVPVVAMTTAEHRDAFLNAAKAGVQDFVVKGYFDADELIRTLHFAIGRHRYTSLLFEQANFDELTGLANRFLFRDRLTHALQRADKSGETVALLLIDIDNFKGVNVKYGRDAGDRFLKIYADALVAHVGNSDTVARIGSDEFGIIIEGLSYPQAAIDVAGKLLAMSQKPVAIGPHRIQAAVNIGIAFHTESRSSAQHWVIEGADAALNTAKQSGKNKYCTYTERLNHDLVERIHQDTLLKSALANDEFHLHYQPIVDTVSKELIACETLIRWQRPGAQPVPPGKFITSLERLGLMREVGQFVLDDAIRRHAEWMRGGVRPISVCVNVSASQFADADFSKRVTALLDRYGLDPALLSLELTEDLLINNSTQTRQIFTELSDLGVRFSIDDFGTGHNSYSYLKNFPISTIKIDRSFTRLLHVDRIDRAIARSQINLARELGLQVIAEGVENHIVLTELEGLEPDGLQGFLIGRPMPVERFERTFLNAEPLASARALSA